MLLLLKLIGWGASASHVVVELRSQAGADGEVFYAGAGEQHHPDRRVAFPIIPDGNWHRYRVEIPIRHALDKVRIDPGSASGTVEIRELVIEAGGNSTVLGPSALASALTGANAMQRTGQGGALRFEANAPDPFVDFDVPEPSGSGARAMRWARWLLAAAVVAGFWFGLAEFVWPTFRRRYPHLLRMPTSVQRIAQHASDEGVVVVPPAAIVVMAAALVTAVLYVALGLHQSSIGIWEKIYPAREVHQWVDLGSAKHIRSDEWNTQSPWVLSQVAEGKSPRNVSVGGEQAPLLASVPVAGPSALAQPKFFGFYLFDSETGFSWWWAYKTIGLLLSFFWLVLVLSRGNVAASALAAVWVYGSSFTQWWLSSNLPELLIAFATATVGAIYLLFAHRRRWIFAGGVLLAFATLNLVLHPYPPFIVPLGYLGIAIVVGVACGEGRLDALRSRVGLRAAVAGGIAVAGGAIGVAYLVQAMPTIEAMANTSYPGRRISGSGEFPLLQLFYGYYEGLRTGESNLPLPPTNASEAAGFAIFFPLLWLALPLRALFGRNGALLGALGVYCVVVGLWIGTPLPRLLEAALQTLGWSWVPSKRAVLGFGIGSILATALLYANIVDRRVLTRPAAARGMLVVLAGGCLLLFGGWLHALDPAFFRAKVILLGSLAGTLVVAGVVLGRAWTFALGLGLMLAAPLMVNPLVSGLAAVSEKPVLVAAAQQGGTASDRWAVIGDFVFSQGLKTHGLEVITGSQMVPNRQMAEVLDPPGRYRDIWNRYAHVVFRSEPGRAMPAFELPGPDLYVVALDVCGPAMAKLAVTRVAYTGPVPPQDQRCLRELDSPADSGVRLFRLLPMQQAKAR